jgi:DNA-binding beta-propeller fold protein YncE
MTMRSRHLLLTTLCMVLAVAGRVPSAQRGTARLLVLNKEDATLAIVDPASGNVLGRVPVGHGPHELVTSTDGKFAFAANYGTGPEPGHTISMIDLVSMKEVRRIDVSPLSRPHGLDFIGGKLYFTAEADKKVARYDPGARPHRVAVRNGADDDAHGDGDEGFDVGHHLEYRQRQRLDHPSRQQRGLGADGGSGGQGALRGSTLSADRRQIWSAHSRDGGVSIIDIASRKVLQTFNIGTKRSNRIKLTPDGKFALVSDVRHGELVVLDAPGARRSPGSRSASRRKAF